jgi:hypothetical protein
MAKRDGSEAASSHGGPRWRARGLVAVALLAAGLTVVAVPPAPPASADAATCEPVSAGGPVFVTETCVDPDLNQPYTDTDEQRTTTDPATNVTVSYRYIHGGFTGTNTRFSLYFPEPSQYRGRFFQSTYPTNSQEDASPDTIAFAISHGAYVVSTNNNGGLPAGIPLAAYRANAASAKHSRVVAAEVYGDIDRPRGHIYGGSGGAYQTIGAVENTEGVWDGSVPFVPGTPNAIPSNQVIQLLGLRVLHDDLPRIVDALEPGGSGRPYAGLDAEERAVLREATRLGFPLRGWWDHEALTGGSFFAVQGGVRALDPDYLDDFWTDPSYEGSDPSVQAARVQQDATVVGLVGSPTSGIELSRVASGELLTGADLTVTSGPAAGRTLTIANVTGNHVSFAGADPSVTGSIRPGDTVRIDNSWSLAQQYYARHQVPTPDMYGWNQYRDANGDPTYPQRPLVGPTLAASTGGSVANGRFHGKMIMLGSLVDIEAFPWMADWYRQRARGAFGEGLDDTFRLWYMDNAGHSEPRSTYANTHIVDYQGEIQQALLDLDAWVAHGTSPPAGTNYHVDADTQLEVPAHATHRRGVQPVVTLSVTASRLHPRAERVDVAVGQPVRFSAEARVPPGTGEIVSAEWDFEGIGTYPVLARIGHPRPTVRLDATHTFTRPGTYFPVVRVASQRDGDPTKPYTRIPNLARVRVVVR